MDSLFFFLVVILWQKSNKSFKLLLTQKLRLSYKIDNVSTQENMISQAVVLLSMNIMIQRGKSMMKMIDDLDTMMMKVKMKFFFSLHHLSRFMILTIFTLILDNRSINSLSYFSFMGGRETIVSVSSRNQELFKLFIKWVNLFLLIFDLNASLSFSNFLCHLR